MRIYTTVFGDEYAVMAEALRRSITKNFPEAELAVSFCQMPKPNKWLPEFITSNDAKMQYWARYAAECPDGTKLVLIDCDTLVLKTLHPVFESQFDIAYTIRDGKVPFNTGVIFLRVNPKTKLIMYQWAEANRKLVKKGSAALVDLAAYAGANQYTWRLILDRYEAKPDGVRFKTLPCALWNCEQENYKNFSGDTAILHVKSWLREIALRNAPTERASEAEVRLARLCKEYGY